MLSYGVDTSAFSTHGADGIPLEMKGGVLRSSQNGGPHLLFVTQHLPQMLAGANPRNIDAVDKMESQDNINP